MADFKNQMHTLLDTESSAEGDDKAKGMDVLRKYGPPEEWMGSNVPAPDEKKLALRVWRSLSRGEQEDLRSVYEGQEHGGDAKEEEAEESPELPADGAPPADDSGLDEKIGKVAGNLDAMLSGTRKSPKMMVNDAVDAAMSKGGK